MSSWRRAREALSIIRSGPFEGTSEEGRSRERLRRLVLSSLASAAVRGISLASTLAIVPLAVRYLGRERYGLWMAITSAVGMLAFADLGMSNGTINAIAEAHGKSDRDAAVRYVSTTFFMLVAIALFLGVSFALNYPYVSWAELFNVNTAHAAAESGPAMAVFVVCFLATLPLGIAQRVNMGYQEGFKASLWSGAGSLLGLIGVLSAIVLEQSLPILVLALAGGPVVAALLNSISVFARERPWLLPRLANVKRLTARRVLRISSLYFALGIASALAYHSDNIVIARILGAGEVTPYAVTMRLFSIAPIILSLALAPLWPAYGEAIARGDLAWVRKSLRRSILIGVVLNTPVAIALLIGGRMIIRLWAGPDVQVSFMLLLGFALWSMLTSLSGPFAMLLNGASLIRFQVIWSSIMAVANIAISIVLVREIGVEGAIFGSVIAQSLFLILPIALHISKLLHRLENGAVVSDSSRMDLLPEQGFES